MRALIAKMIGKPVRVIGMRSDATGWTPKGPASVHKVRAAVDKDGKVIGWDFSSKGFSRLDVNSNESAVYDTLAGTIHRCGFEPDPCVRHAGGIL